MVNYTEKKNQIAVNSKKANLTTAKAIVPNHLTRSAIVENYCNDDPLHVVTFVLQFTEFTSKQKKVTITENEFLQRISVNK